MGPVNDAFFLKKNSNTKFKKIPHCRNSFKFQLLYDCGVWVLNWHSKVLCFYILNLVVRLYDCGALSVKLVSKSFMILFQKDTLNQCSIIWVWQTKIKVLVYVFICVSYNIIMYYIVLNCIALFTFFFLNHDLLLFINISTSI